MCHCYFFFQAEDGIRGLYVTGVQTCALPIYQPHRAWGVRVGRCGGEQPEAQQPVVPVVARTGRGVVAVAQHELAAARSEERRVGKSVELGGCLTNIKKSMNYVVE